MYTSTNKLRTTLHGLFPNVYEEALVPWKVNAISL